MNLPEFDPRTVPPEQIPAVMSTFAAWLAQLSARVLQDPTAATRLASVDDEVLTPEQACALLKQDRRWLSRNAHRLPFVRRISPRRFVCSRAGIVKWLAIRKV